MKIFLASLISLMLITGAAAAEGACGRTPVMSVSTPDQGTIELIVDGEALKKAPRWDERASEPPLPISRVAELSLTWARNHYARFDNVELSEIRLKRAPCSSMHGYWFYVVEFTPQLEGAQMLGPGNWLGVLMDGTLVEPVKRDSM